MEPTLCTKCQMPGDCYCATGRPTNSDPRHRNEITVDLDTLNLELEQGFSSGYHLLTVRFKQGGKDVVAHLDLYQHGMKPSPSLRLCIVNRQKDVTKQVQVRPWK